MTTMHEPVYGAQDFTRADPQSPHVARGGNGPQASEPVQRLTWTDPITGARGYLVVHTLVSDLATGGTRMRAGCTISEVEDLARGMAMKTAAFGLPVGGAKGGIDFDPKDPRALDVLERFCRAMRPWLDAHWVTAEDLGVSQRHLDEVFARVGLGQSFHAAIGRSAHPEATLERVHEGMQARIEGGQYLADVIGGYGVAQACLAVAKAWGWRKKATTVAIQGVGTMGGGTAWYLHEAGVKVVAIADATGTVYRREGLDVPALLDIRDEYGELDRDRLPAGTEVLPRDAIISTDADILVPAAISYALRAENVGGVRAMVVVEAANAATTGEAETILAERGVAVIPDFVANAGSAAWAWWLLLGYVGTDPEDSYARLRMEMRAKVKLMASNWTTSRTLPRHTAWEFAAANAQALADHVVTVP